MHTSPRSISGVIPAVLAGALLLSMPGAGYPQTGCLRPAALTDDFRPAAGRDSSLAIGADRLLVAESDDGLFWTRTNLVLSDRASVADALVLPSGRILVYYVTGCKVIGGVEQKANDTVVAVSDDNGRSWTYRDVAFSNEPSGGTKPVDPNVILLDDGSIRMLVTIDPDQAGSARPQTYTALSTGGGLSFALGGGVFSVDSCDVLDPEHYRFGAGNWRLYCGGVPGSSREAVSTDDGESFSDHGPFSTITDSDGSQFVVADITAFGDSLWRMYAFGKIGTAEGIRSLHSSDGVSWTADDGNRLTAADSSGVESERVWAPSVVKRADGSFLMVYETIIPAAADTVMRGVRLLADGTTFAAGETGLFAARGVFADSTLRDVTRVAVWASSNPSVAAVDLYGTVSALSPGSARISASCGALADTVTVTVESPVGIGGPGAALPEAVTFAAAYPNPFNPSTVIAFTLARNARVSIRIHAAGGQTVDELPLGTMPAGSHHVVWNAAGMPSGVYFFTVDTGGFRRTGKMTLIR